MCDGFHPRAHHSELYWLSLMMHLWSVLEGMHYIKQSSDSFGGSDLNPSLILLSRQICTMGGLQSGGDSAGFSPQNQAQPDNQPLQRNPSKESQGSNEGYDWHYQDHPEWHYGGDGTQKDSDSNANWVLVGESDIFFQFANEIFENTRSKSFRGLGTSIRS